MKRPSGDLGPGVFWWRDARYIFIQDPAKARGAPVFRVRVRDAKAEALVNSSRIPQSDFNSYQLLGLAPGDAPIASIMRSNSEICALDVVLP
jgi:hypothetical protein